MLPASFILRLDKPMPISMVLVQQLKQLQTESSTFLTTTSAQPPASLINLIVKNATNNEIESMTKGLFISLPDQCHYYFMTENTALQVSSRKLLFFIYFSFFFTKIYDI
jgi:mediator of RNA polymerase II transcription subunit 1